MFSVALIGPDGAGKTTISRKIQTSLPLPVKYLYMGINPEASNRMLPTTRLMYRMKRACGAKPDTAGPPDPARLHQKPKSLIKRLARGIKKPLSLVNRMGDEWYRQLIVWYYQWRGNIVLFDRHFLFDFYSYDVALNGQPKAWTRRVHGWMLSKLYPKPDLVIFLDAPGEVLYARKGEGTPELLEQRRQEYRKIGDLVSHFTVVDATQPENEVLQQVNHRIEEYYRQSQAATRKQAREPNSVSTRAKQRVLVTDAGVGSSLAIIRSLGRQGYDVIAADSHPRSPGLKTRYAHERVLYPSPFDSPAACAETLLKSVREHKVDLVIPTSDAVILALSPVRAQLEAVCQVALPAEEALKTAGNKSATRELAEELGIPTPRTTIVESVNEAIQAASSLQWPLVLKPQVSRAYQDESSIEGFEVCYAEDRAQLEQQMSRFAGRCPVLLQEYCAGTGYGVELLMHEGRVLAAFQHRRLREIPITGGASAYRESVPLDPVLYEHAVNLLQSIDWTGLAMVEFKVGPTGPRLMEINGRVWGSLPLAVQSGVDFPLLLARLSLDGPPVEGTPPLTSYRIGQRVHNLQRELMWITSVLLGRKRYPFLDFPRRSQAVTALLGLMNPLAKYDILSLKDLRPSLWELARIARKFRSKLNESA